MHSSARIASSDAKGKGKGKRTVKAIDLRDLPALVVAAQEQDLVGVARLEAHEVRDGLEAVVAAVNKVALGKKG